MNDSANKLVAKQPLIQEFHQRWSMLSEAIRNAVGPLPYATEVLLNRAEQYLHDLSPLHLTLAVAGVGTSGKSSLVNLLCGAEIMPTGVQEISTAIVMIEHHHHNRVLKIPPVEGLPAEYSGEWADLPDTEISQRLHQLMQGYIELRTQQREPPIPHIEIQYPMRLGKWPEWFSCPSPAFKLRILDLPGLKYVADDYNWKFIREEIKSALCLVTYNAEDTDPIRQKASLAQVVEKVRELRGSPARMLFILSKIDVFLKDTDGATYKQKFIETTTAGIRSAIAEGLPEFKEEVEAIKVAPLSAYPALSAYRAMTGSVADSIHELEQVAKYFYQLMPEEVIEELPRRIARWEADDRRRVAAAVWWASDGEQFEQALQQHINDHFLQPLYAKFGSFHTYDHFLRLSYSKFDQLFDVMAAGLAAANALVQAESRQNPAFSTQHPALLSEISAFRAELPQLLF